MIPTKIIYASIAIGIFCLGVSYFSLKNSGAIELGGFIADQVKREQEEKRVERERRGTLSSEDRAREDMIALERQKLELEKAKIEAQEFNRTFSQLNNLTNKAIELEKAETRRRSSLSAEERAREDALEAQSIDTLNNLINKIPQ